MKTMPKKTKCEWKYDDDIYFFDTGCGEAFSLNNDSTLKENKIEYCPFCGKKITEVAR